MNHFLSTIRSSAKELQKTVCVTTTAMLTGLYVVLHTFTTIVINAVLQLRFSGIALAMIGALYGPVAGALSGGIGDLLKCVIRPTGGFFPGFTLAEMIRGAIYGFFLYKKKPTALRVFLACFCSCFVCDFILTTLWLTMMGNGAFLALLLSRALRCAIMVPIEFVLVYGSMQAVVRVRRGKFA